MKSNCAIVTGSTSDRLEEAGICLELLRRWSGNTGNDYYFEHIPVGVHPMCWKYEAVRKHLADHKIVAWMDVDSVVLNTHFDLLHELERWSNPSTNFWISQDWNGICSAFFAVRSGEWGHDLCTTVAFCGQDLIRMVDPDVQKVLNCKAEGDQVVMKFFYSMLLKHRWRMTLLPYSFVTERASRPWPMPFAWHCGPDPVVLMKGAFAAIEDGTIEHFCQNYEPMKHGVRYDL